MKVRSTRKAFGVYFEAPPENIMQKNLQAQKNNLTENCNLKVERLSQRMSTESAEVKEKGWRLF